MAQKSFQKTKVRLYAAALSFLIVAFSFCPILEVFADDSSKVAVSSDDITTVISVDDSTSIDLAYSGSDIEVIFKIPLYFRFDFSNSNYTNTYLSGALSFPSLLSKFTYTVNGVVPKFMYFEPVTDNGYSLARIDATGRFYLDNFHVISSVGNTNRYLLGYMYFSATVSSYTALFTFTNTTYTVQYLSSSTLYSTTAPFGLANAIAYSINNATDIDTIINELYLIRNNSVLLADVIDNLENINGILGNIYNYMATMNNTQLNSMRQLVYALSGVDLSTTSASALSQATYNRWVQLIYDAINYQGPDSSAADQAADNLEDAHEANDLAQDSAYQSADTAMQNVNFNVTVPNGLTNAALTIGNYITSIYSQLGSDLQFLITATLTIGLITVILGVINRYPKNTYTTESETISTGERNGKKFSSSYKTTTKRTRYR